MSTSTMPDDVDDIRREMARIRMQMHQDVRNVVATAEAVTDWHRYLTAFPWVTLGAAFALGYVIVPKRKRSAATRDDISRVKDAVEATRQTLTETVRERPAATQKSKGLVRSAIAFAAPFAVRAAQGYALNYFENWLAQQQMNMTTGPKPGPSAAATGQGPRPQRGPVN